jgi:hypothetical protein
LVGAPAKIISKWPGVAIVIMLLVFTLSIFLGVLSMIPGILIFIIIMGFGFILPSYTKKGALTK